MARIEQSELAAASKVSIDTVKRLERTVGPVSANIATVNSIVRVLEAAGIEFTNGEQPGVRLKSYKLKDAGQNAFLLDPPFGTWIGFGAVDAKRKVIIHVQDLALQHLNPKISGGAEHVRAVEEHRSKIFKIAAEKYELGLVEPDDIISVMYDDVAG